MDFKPTVKNYAGGSLEWLGSATGTGDAMSVTLDVTKFATLKGAHGDVIPAGAPLKKESDGTYGLVTQNSDTLAGFLLVAQPNKGEKQVAPMIWHGRIRTDKFPTGLHDVDKLTIKPAAFVFTKEA